MCVNDFFGFGLSGRILAVPACLRLICKSSFNPLTPVEISQNHHDGNNIVFFS